RYRSAFLDHRYRQRDNLEVSMTRVRPRVLPPPAAACNGARRRSASRNDPASRGLIIHAIFWPPPWCRPRPDSTHTANLVAALHEWIDAQLSDHGADAHEGHEHRHGHTIDQ